mmetsp:Transcript_61695/g.201330  ORF Transcript_61695/g.201330 Transcript_61695/m.201330 type:complete len:420 (+) Transcript_61695:284-1543(+)
MSALLPSLGQQTPPTEFGDFRRGEELGSGGFARVFRCWRRSPSSAGRGEAFAVKVLNLRRMRLSNTAERNFENLRRETEILKAMPSHPNVVRLVDCVEEAHWFFLVLELVPGGDLLSNLARRIDLTSAAPERRCLAGPEAAFVLRQLVDGLTFLHGRGVVHRDLKLENVLVSSSQCKGALTLYNVKISDFGLSKASGEGISEPHSMVGTRRYVAPEVLSGASYDYRVDLWSLGVLLYLLLDGRFPHEQPAQAPQPALDAAVARLPTGRAVQALVSGLLRRDPGRRVALSELAAHPWVASAGAMGQGSPSAAGVRAAGVGAEASMPPPLLGSLSGRCSSAALGSYVGFSANLEGMLLPPAAPAHSLASSSSLGASPSRADRPSLVPKAPAPAQGAADSDGEPAPASKRSRLDGGDADIAS